MRVTHQVIQCYEGKGQASRPVPSITHPFVLLLPTTSTFPGVMNHEGTQTLDKNNKDARGWSHSLSHGHPFALIASSEILVTKEE